MKFSDFDQLMHSGIGGKKKPKDFTYELLSNITDFGEEENLLLELSDELLRKLYSGGRSIKNTAQLILPYLDTNKFALYLESNCQDGAAEHIISRLEEHGFITCRRDFVDDVTELFKSILIDSTKRKRASAAKKAPASEDNIKEYLSDVRSKHYTAKTLLYTAKSKPIYDFYVPNDLYDAQYNNYAYYEIRDDEEEDKKRRISADSVLLSFKKHFIVITGTGGLGKTMLMHHLVLTMIKNYDTYKKLPIVIYLRSYKAESDDLVSFIQEQVPMLNLIEHLESGSCVFLLDGMDEIKSDYIRTFEKQLSEMADKYPKNHFIMTSRPISEFIALNRFAVYALAPFTKEQALELIDRLEYRPEVPELKANFRRALDEKLFAAHRDFAEIPLLLTILLMTYERHARIPAKLHVFYKQAFETLVEKHDTTKIGFDRIYATKMFPEEFVKLLEEFCARAYFNEDYEFTDAKFDEYFGKLKCLPELMHRFSCTDLKRDMTNNLCLMYYDGGVFRYIHRTFQEYFCAAYVSKSFDEKFTQIWKVFERLKNKSIDDHTFDMLYDMNQKRTEQLILIPFLEDLFTRCKADDPMEEYWNFLEIVYPVIHYSNGKVHYSYDNQPFSYIYLAIIRKLGTLRMNITNGIPYKARFERERYLLVDEDGEEVVIAADDYDEQEDYEFLEVCGHNCTIDVAEARYERGEIHDLLESSNFPYMLEYIEVKKLLHEIKERNKRVPGDLYSSIFD